VGVKIEVMGYGGPRFGQFRPYTASRIAWDYSPLAMDAPSISGDSGAGVIYDGQLIGVQYGSTGLSPPASLQGSSGSVPLVYPASSKATPQTLTQFLGRACQIGYGQQCRPVVGGQRRMQIQVQPQQGGVDDQFYPGPGDQGPVDQGGGSDVDLNSPANSPANCQSCDTDQIVTEVIAALDDADMQGEAGPAGPQGPQGPRGPQGTPGASGEVTPEQIAQIAAIVTEQLRKDPGLRGPAGPAGVPGTPQSIDYDDLAGIISARITHPSQRVVLVDGEDGTVIDDETYDPGEPIVLNFRRIINAAKQR
jgi:hypothetical protein